MEQEKLNPTLVYVLALLALPCCCIWGSGFILSGAAFFIANNKLNKVKANPEAFEPSSVKAMQTAKIVALVILIINVLTLIWSIYKIATGGGIDGMMEEYQRAMEEFQSQQQNQ